MEPNTAKPPYVRFEVRMVEDRPQSQEQGHYVAKDIIYALVTPSGSKDIFEKEAEQWIKDLQQAVQEERFPREWFEAYKSALKQWRETREDPEFGTPLKSWPGISPAELANCQNANIRSVEQLAEASEEACARIGMGSRGLKSKAIAWLDSSSGTGKIAAQLDNLRTENEALTLRDGEREAELKTLTNRLASLEKLLEKQKA